ncbi:hypothetical protein TNIN_239131 [Trichonephila inaurata madagascariensis]|uniref:Uncharacterized protein n=1 Tax=Trichonephila inaurata madagascariensis TaxID=2747483 RepID=A0A8X7CFL3_9ARAC|nr:hypothetical protein TNIN_239131 [Trichonephila inaurata madagascariensis]
MLQEPIEYTTPDFVARLVTQAEKSRQLARIRTLAAQEKDRRRYNSRHRAVLYQPGDLVWIYIPVREVGRSVKTVEKVLRAVPSSAQTFGCNLRGSRF